MPQPSPTDIASVSSDPLVQEHYAAQAGVTTALLLAIRKLWRLLNMQSTETLQETMPTYIAGVQAVTQHYSLAAAFLASENFQAMRVQAGVTEPFRTPMVDPPPAEQIEATVRWATSDLWKTFSADPDVESPLSLPEVEQSVIDKVEGSAIKLVGDTGRNEMLEAIVADKRARGYARVCRDGACWFCMMLATRGAVYDKDSFDASNAKFTGAYEAKAHNDDHCTLVPIFSNHYEPSAAVRAAKELYDEVTKNKSGKAKAKAFRRAYEGRADGPERTATNSTSKKRNPKRTPIDMNRDVDAGRTVEELRATLAALETSAKKFTSPGTEARIAELRRKIAARG